MKKIPVFYKPITVSFALSLFVLFGCGKGGESEYVEFTENYQAMGTDIAITALAEDEAAGKRAAENGFLAIDYVDTIASTYDPESDISRINSAPGEDVTAVSAQFTELLIFSLAVADDTGGRFNPAIMPLVELYGLKTQQPCIPDDAEIEEALPLIDYSTFDVSAESSMVTKPVDGMTLDLSGVAKGWAVDRAVEAMMESGAAGGLVEAGGEVRCWGADVRGKPWTLAIAHPGGEGIWGTFELERGSVATSGDYVQKFEYEGVEFSHILDPTTGKPAEGPVSVSVLADDCATADAWATALMTLPAKDALALVAVKDDLECYIIDEPEEGEYKVYRSEGFGEVSPAE
jgi:thiamine biosynthesis lipoprotein